MKTPYDIIKSRYVTEKATVLSELHKKESNPSLRKCQNAKYVFVVNSKANKREIAEAVEAIYAEKNIKVVAVNTINVKSKRRTVRGRAGQTSAFKKAIITLQAGGVL